MSTDDSLDEFTKITILWATENNIAPKKFCGYLTSVLALIMYRMQCPVEEFQDVIEKCISYYDEIQENTDDK